MDRSGINTGAVKQRIGERVSLGVLDCFIKRLGHVVLTVKDFDEIFAWYPTARADYLPTNRFG